MQQIHGTVMNYPWGTPDAIPAILGTEPDGTPVAEYWLGAHPLAPSTVGADGAESLDALLEREPRQLGKSAIVYGSRLPFLMKILSAASALSIQTHPSRQRAQRGYAREESLGIPRNDPERVYKDDWPKPEIMVALSEMQALVGFRPLGELGRVLDEFGLRHSFEDAFGAGLFARPAVDADLLRSVMDDEHPAHELVEAIQQAVPEPGWSDAARELQGTARELQAQFPGDPGVLAALFMNRVTLRPGEALYVPDGVIHAHLRGTGIEVMANSDNVIRGGLTGKHVAVDELMRVLDFEAEPEIIAGTEVAHGVVDYPSACPEFDVWRLEVDARGIDELPAHGAPRIILVTGGSLLLTDADGVRLPLDQGCSAFISAQDARIQVTGEGQAFVATPGDVLRGE
ncbi:mannose-6-phosphate isomerase, class I [Nigerium sp.]|uniref:mannose-6-phosphate isomerase, class I n=1 Tax=Nigerium sp. TaxID=2042655 RepID=UPI003221D21A